MHLELNPYNPGSGLPPRVMGGRQQEMDAFDLIVARTKRDLPNRGMVLSGLRGVGKTVLLNYLRSHADNHGWFTIWLEGKPEAQGFTEVREKFARELTSAARRYNGPSGKDRLREAFGTIQSFNLALGVPGIKADISVSANRANSGTIDIDLEELVEDVSLALKADKSAFAIFIDEMQDLDQELLSALITVQHAAGQRGWPFYIVGAGLPNLPTTLSEARTYAERLFTYRTIGPLADTDAHYALTRPAKEMGAEYSQDALDVLLDASGRYPYFIQEFGKAIWDAAPSTPFTEEDAEVAVSIGRSQLDAGFFSSRWGRATRKERGYLRAMAHDGDAGSSTSQIAERLGVKVTALGPARAQLINKGIIYSPKYGQVAFTVPGMSGFILRQQED
ncbi:ATP-binding protein [Arthrobacter burdickii]|uniref:ATP-binding protein n=1 Tax=Arthrobacter burdickii TaxID=3035920 RepID=A0ABT8K2B4_9MICC|nr:ATP-binding protein [Arthrobacter burdickii]MDN4611574.1 ATP-binding protein [Arthrobacter burdickii]